MLSLKQASWLFLLLLCMACSGWYFASNPNFVKLDAHMLSKMADMTIRQLSVRQFDANGHLSHHLTTPLAHHIPIQNTHWLKTPTLVISQKEAPKMILNAPEATATKGGQHIIFGGGEIQLDQGHTHLRATKAITESNANHQLIKATAEGHGKNQAHYWTKNTKDNREVHAYADVIVYLPTHHTIELEGHAHVQQGEDSFSGDKISYDTLHRHVTSKSTGLSRTTIIFHPGKKT